MTHHPEESTNPNAAVVTAIMAALTALDVEGVLAHLTDDVRFELPFEQSLPDLDRDAFRGLLNAMVEMYRQFSIRITHVYDLEDRDTVIARYEGDCVGRTYGEPYANSYVGFFRFRDGKVWSWREYANPKISEAAIAEHGARAAAAATG
jgi:ketosteroid isomerase-like protein